MTENNPASNLIDIAEKAPPETQYPHLVEAELPEFLRALEKSSSGTIVRTAAWLTLLTASRPGMTRWAEWAEVDLDTTLWTVPGVKMKMRRDHVVPLPTQAVELIKDLHGSRQTCETLLSEFGWDENWRDMHLAHKKAGLKGVYDKATYLPQRQKMVQWYADYLDALRDGVTGEQRAAFKAKVNSE